MHSLTQCLMAGSDEAIGKTSVLHGCVLHPMSCTQKFGKGGVQQDQVSHAILICLNQDESQTYVALQGVSVTTSLDIHNKVTHDIRMCGPHVVFLKLQGSYFISEARIWKCFGTYCDRIGNVLEYAWVTLVHNLIDHASMNSFLMRLQAPSRE